MRQRRQSFLARRGAQKVARKWLKRRGTGAGAVEEESGATGGVTVKMVWDDDFVQKNGFN